MQQITYIPRLAAVITLAVLLSITVNGYSQASIGGTTCVIAGTQYSYVLYAYYSGTGNFTYTISGGTLSTGGTSGTHSGPGSVGILVTWTTHGSITLNSPAGFAVLTTALTTPFTPGSFTSGQAQNISYGTTPATINCAAPTGGTCVTPNDVYQWQQSPDGINFMDLNGATSQNLSFTAGATQTTYYRRFVTETTGNNTGYSPIASVILNPPNPILPVNAGSITPAVQNINYNTTPASLSSIGVANGNYTYSYQWQSSPDNATWSNIPCAVTAYSPGVLTSTTYFRVAVTSNGVTAFSNPAMVNVYPKLNAGLITPASINIVAGGNPGGFDCSQATGGNGSYVYQWQSSTDGINFQTNISGATSLTYLPGILSTNNWYRVMVTSNGVTAYSNVASVVIVTGPPDLSFVQTRNILKAGVPDSATAAALTSPYDVSQTTQYFDGLGRQVQTVAMQQTPMMKDLVSFIQYDGFGRQTYKFLPYAATSSDGSYKYTDAANQYNFNNTQFPGEQYYYGQVNCEPSPLNRVMSEMSPGLNWNGSGRGTTYQYQVNTVSDSVRIWTIAPAVGSIPSSTSVYVPGMLYKNVTSDEAGHQVVEYKDMDERTVLKKVQSANSPGAAHVGWLCTYYVYDDMRNLRFVISPRAVELINVAGTWAISTSIANELCFRYEYDFRRRMNIKKIPGAGEVHMVYDERNRLVMSQDSNLRSQQQWVFTCYDALNRPDSTGLMTDPTNYNNLSYHTTAATQSATYPNLSSYTVQLMTRNFYDDYKWVATTGAPVQSAFDASHSGSSTWFNTSYNVSPAYAVAITPFYITRGMPTGVAKIIIGSTSQYMYTSMFYDDRGRIIQTSSNNYGLGKDTVTNQYNFTGKVLRSLHGHSRVTNTAQSHMIMTQMDYDQANRLNHIYKLIDNPSSLQLIASMQYDELGQLNIKNLGNSLDQLVYSYNIRGWLTGINKNYVGGTTHNSFGMELAYDNATSITGTTYATPQFNGNIAGVIWKSSGDAINRKYDFTYDTVNRLTGANFNQYIGGTWGKSSGGSSPVTIDFSVSGLGYDANGNIQSMIQQGFKIGGTGTPIDSLTYTYTANSNKLLQVHDEYNDTASVLGDFHYKGVKGSGDYSYDGNGNLAKDNNKGIGYFSYNYLNLPATVYMKGKGYITYIYDAGGTKLEKQVKDSTTGTMTFTSYLGEFQYTRRAPFSNINAGSDTLQFITTEEGRARWAFHKHAAGDTVTYPEYDFVERDHLGNERVLLTQERDTTQYVATMEAVNRATENALFYNIGTTCVARTSVPAPGYPDDLTYTNPNDSVVKLNGNGPTVGPAIILKVMAGDIVDVSTQFYYNSGTYTSGPPISAQNLLNSLASGLATISAAAGENITTLTNPTSSPLLAALTSSISNDSATGTTKPQAYLNWVLLDKQFRYVAGSCSGAMQVGAAGQNGGGLQPPLIQRNIPMSQSGYLYIYVSNATKGWDVFFDNMSVHLYTRQLLEENHYYPFGLTMAGISDKAIKTQYAENKYRFNKGSELQNKEFNDGSGLELYETQLRSLDPQLGRWWQVDSKPTMAESPYAAMGNNPILRNDPLGDSGIGPLLSRAVQSNGGGDWLGVTGIRGAIVRSDYNKETAKIDPNSATAKEQRTDLKESTRDKTPEPYKSAIEAGRPMKDERAKINDPTVNNPTKTNAEFNDAAGAGGTIGTGLVIVGMVQSSYTIANSNQPVKEAFTEATGWAGAVYVGGQFATAGAAGGPYVSTAAGILGGFIGFTLGKSAGDATITAASQWKGTISQTNEESKKEGCNICLLDH